MKNDFRPKAVLQSEKRLEAKSKIFSSQQKPQIEPKQKTMDFLEEEYDDANSAVAALFRPNGTSSARWRPGAAFGADDVNLTSESPTPLYDHRDQFQFVVYAVVGTLVNSFGFLGNILTLIVLFSMHPRTSVTLYIIGEERELREREGDLFFVAEKKGMVRVCAPLS